MNGMILSGNGAEPVWCQANDGVYAGFSFLSNGPITTVKQTFSITGNAFDDIFVSVKMANGLVSWAMVYICKLHNNIQPGSL